MTTRLALLGALVAVAIAGCGAGGPLTTPPLATAPPTVAPTPGDLAPTDPLEGPPAAALAAEGGDPVIGQLGTYQWLDGGSTSPWLPGSPITVGAGEPLGVRLDPATPIAMWQARLVPGDAEGPAGAVTLATGIADPSFQAPPPGTWTVEVRITFADGLGEASYAWRLEIP